jgi:hypothetical protein
MIKKLSIILVFESSTTFANSFSKWPKLIHIFDIFFIIALIKFSYWIRKVLWLVTLVMIDRTINIISCWFIWTYFFKNSQSWTNLLREYIYIYRAVLEKAVLIIVLFILFNFFIYLWCPLFWKSNIFRQNLLVWYFCLCAGYTRNSFLLLYLFSKYRKLRMKELAPVAVRTESCFMELDACLGLEIRR